MSIDWLFLVDMEKKKVNMAIPTKNLKSVFEIDGNIVVEMKDGGDINIPSDSKEIMQALNRMLQLSSSEIEEL